MWCYNKRMKNRIRLLAVLLILGLASISKAAAPRLTPEMVVDHLYNEFAKIRDARTDFTIETNLFLLGCGGTMRQTGYGWFKAPDNLKVYMNKITYIFKGNLIKRIDAEKKTTYWRFLNAPDFSVGYSPRLITHNFNLRIVRDAPDEVVIEGLPKPGVLKNVNRVTFRVDPEKWLLKRLDISFANKNLSGYADVSYEKMGGIMAPVGTAGRSAFQSRENILIGFNFRLRGQNMRINTGIPDSEFK